MCGNKKNYDLEIAISFTRKKWETYDRCTAQYMFLYLFRHNSSFVGWNNKNFENIKNETDIISVSSKVSWALRKWDGCQFFCSCVCERRASAKNNCRCGSIKVKTFPLGNKIQFCVKQHHKKVYVCTKKIILCFSALNPHLQLYLRFFLGKLFFSV